LPDMEAVLNEQTRMQLLQALSVRAGGTGGDGSSQQYDCTPPPLIPSLIELG